MQSIADIMGISTSTVSTRMGRGLDRLRNDLGVIDAHR